MSDERTLPPPGEDPQATRAGSMPPDTGNPAGQATEQDPADANRTLAPRAQPTTCRAVVPGYEILRELGRGGMGVVYLARHTKLNRTVALKMILAGGHAGAEEVARFVSEAEAVAQLQHPHIVQVYDSGESGGLPYFSLEFVPGGTLAGRVREQPLPPPEAAAIVEQLARGMAYAHANGIVHRDLKPENVLLAEDGTPKITDFGLAKRVEGDSGLTASGAVMGTPSYMAPEQARGQTHHIGPPADVYALGAILYRLLTGRPPFQAATVMDTLLQVMEAEPPSVTQLQPKVPRDLETITLKCLQKEPARRYASAHELAEDLRRFRAGEPILARPVGRVERAVKWVRRRPAVAALSAALLFAVAGGFALVTLKWLDERAALAGEQEARLQAERKETEAHQARDHERDAKEKEAAARQTAQDKAREAEARRKEALEQRDAARRYFAKAQDAVDKMLTRVSEDEALLRDEPRLELVRKKLLEEALHYYQDFLAEKSDDPSVRFATAKAYQRVAGLYRKLGDAAGADKHFTTALEMLTALHRAAPAEPAYRAELARTAHLLAVGTLEFQKLTPRGEPLFREALELGDALVQEFPAEPSYREELANACNTYGLGLVGVKRLPEAVAMFTKSLALREQLAKECPDNAAYRQDVSQSLHNLGSALRVDGNAAGAEDYFRKSLAIRRQLVEEFPNHPDHRLKFGRTAFELAKLLAGGSAAAKDEAEKLYHEVLQVREALAADFPNIPAYREDVGLSCNTVAPFMEGRGKGDATDTLYRRSLEVWDKLAAEFPANVPYRRPLRFAAFHLGRRAKDRAAAEDYFRRSAAAAEEVVAAFPDNPIDREALALSCEFLGRHLHAEGKGAEGAKLLWRAVEMRTSLAAAAPNQALAHQKLGQAWHDLGLALDASGNRAAAEWAFRGALAVRTRVVAESPAAVYRHELAWTCHNLARMLAAAGSAEAEPLFVQALALFDKAAAEAPKSPAYRQDLAAARKNTAALFTALATAALSQGHSTEASGYAGKLAALPGLAVDQRLAAARLLGRCAAAAAADPLASEPALLARACADAAVEQLALAVQDGAKLDVPGLRRDPDLAALRDHGPFQALLQQLDGKQD